ncbi:MAG: hypothetical protein BWY18_00855 [Candidatus Cloacimonetes bacterium ADurb.Bin211]|nr:MAG: hypothetical protein BWY18_00855 [Candidatus Cloacimonetes bacterium ADurb.Bin211]
MIIQDCSTSHIAFSDEAYWNIRRYRAIALITSSYEDYKILSAELENIIQSCNISELKWKNVSVKTGLKVINFVFNHLDTLRIDVLIYDIEDSRHKNVKNRDEAENLQRLYYHLLHFVLKNCWQNDATWNWYPDEHNCIKWVELYKFLSSSSWSSDQDFFNMNNPVSFYNYYKINDIVPCKSDEHPFIQLADFFAGMGAYSYQAFNIIKSEFDKEIDQIDLFKNNKSYVLSNNQKNRIPLIKEVYKKALNLKFNLDFVNTSGLCSKPTKDPLNFWLYKPQSDKDKAPTKYH